MTQKVLVTGAAGFVGSHLLPKLVEQGYKVIGVDKPSAISDFTIDNSNYQQYYADICNDFQMERLQKCFEKFDAVIHLAALAAPRVVERTDPAETFRINVYGTYNVLKMAKETGVSRIIFPSSAHVYGISPRYIPTDEFHPLALQDTYTSSKIIGEHLCQLFYQNHNISYVALRMFNGYGPRQSLDYFIPAKIMQAIKEKRIILHGRHITKDFVYVDDIVDAIMKALASEYVGPLNVGTGVQTTLEYVANYIAKAFNVPLSFAETEDRGPTHMQCDNFRIKRHLGWVPKIMIEEGLSKTIESFRMRSK